MQKMGVSGIVARALTLVEKVQGAGQHKVDASHDSFHVLRVLATARRLVRPSPFVVLATATHWRAGGRPTRSDDAAWRSTRRWWTWLPSYTTSTIGSTARPPMTPPCRTRKYATHDSLGSRCAIKRADGRVCRVAHGQRFLEGEKEVTEEMQQAVLDVIRNMGFKEQLSSNGQRNHVVPLRPELAIVQDAGQALLHPVVLRGDGCLACSSPGSSLCRPLGRDRCHWSCAHLHLFRREAYAPCPHLLAYLVTHILHFYLSLSLAGPGTPLYDPSCPPRTTMTKEEYVSNPNGSTIKYYSNDAHENTHTHAPDPLLFHQSFP